LGGSSHFGPEAGGQAAGREYPGVKTFRLSNSTFHKIGTRMPIGWRRYVSPHPVVFTTGAPGGGRTGAGGDVSSPEATA